MNDVVSRQSPSTDAVGRRWSDEYIRPAVATVGRCRGGTVGGEQSSTGGGGGTDGSGRVATRTADINDNVISTSC